MMILASPTSSLQIALGGAAATNQLPFSASYVDGTTTTYNPAAVAGLTNNTSPVTVVPGPASQTQRQIKGLSVVNSDIAPAEVILTRNDNGTISTVLAATLSVGDNLTYEEGAGWRVIDSTGAAKQGGGGSGGGITALAGDVTASGPGTANATIAANAVSGSKFRQSAASSLVGNATGSAANVQDIPLGATLSVASGALQTGAMTGDVTALANSFSTTVSAHAITYAKMQQEGAQTLLGNPTGGAANVQEITLGSNLSFSGSVLNAASGGITGLIGDMLASGSGSSVVATNTEHFNVKNPTYGALGNGKVLKDITTTASSAVITSASYTFVAGDVGKSIALGAGTSVATTGNTTSGSEVITGLGTTTGLALGQWAFGAAFPAGATITHILSSTSVAVSRAATASGTGSPLLFINTFSAVISSVSGGAATLSAAATTSRSGNATATFGTDDTAALNAAVTAANAAGGGLIFLPKGIYIVSNSITWLSNCSLMGVGAGKSIIKWISASDQTVPVISNSGATYDIPSTDCQFSYFEIDCDASTLATYNVNAKGLALPFSVRSTVDHVYVHGTPASSICTDFGAPTQITNCIIVNAGRLLQAGSGGGNGIGDGTLSADYIEEYVFSNNIIINAGNCGILLEAQSASTDLTSHATITGNVIITSRPAYLAVNGEGGGGIVDAGSRGTVIVGNHIIGLGSLVGGAGITSNAGTYSTPVPSVEGIISGNYILNMAVGIIINYVTEPVSTTLPCKYSIADNTVLSCIGAGIELVTNATVAMDTVKINDNIVSLCGRAGIFIAGTAAVNNLVMNGNVISNNGTVTVTDIEKSGIEIATPVANLTMMSNTCFDNSTGTQKYGVSIKTGIAVTNALIAFNNLRGNASSAMNLVGTLAGWVEGNIGYNPLGAVSVTPGASPWTYTAAITPEVLYLSGGTVSAVVKNGITLAAASGINIPLDPGEAVTITYSAAPTAATDKK